MHPDITPLDNATSTEINHRGLNAEAQSSPARIRKSPLKFPF